MKLILVSIFCSAIAYQFGITKEGRNSKSLRFIAVDESFSNQDEEKATCLMHIHLVQRVNNRHSILYNMKMKELLAKKN